MNQSSSQIGPGETQMHQFHLQIPSDVEPGMKVLLEVIGSINDEVTGHVWIEVNVLSASTISLEITPITILANETVHFKGAISPARVGAPVYIHITQPDGATYEIGGFTDASGAYSLSTGLNGKEGEYSVYAYWLGDSQLLGDTSATKTYSVSLILPTIPGYPLEAIIVGVFSAFMMIFIVRRRSKRK